MILLFSGIFTKAYFTSESNVKSTNLQSDLVEVLHKNENLKDSQEKEPTILASEKIKPLTVKSVNAISSIRNLSILKDLELNDEVILELYHKDKPYAQFNPYDEVIDLRNENSKTFDNHDGTYTALMTSGPSHYLEDGYWKTSANTIIPVSYAGYDYANIHNEIKTYYGDSKKGIAFFENKTQEIAKYKISSMRLYDADKNPLQSIEAFQNTSAKVSKNDVNIVNYALNSHTNYSVEQLTGSIKSQYTIQKNVFNTYPKDAYVGFEEILTFQEKVEASDYTVSIGKVIPGAKNKPVSFINHEGKTLLNYSDLMYFSKDKYHERAEADYLIEKVDERNYKLTMLIPIAWLQDAKTQYPVVIDPYISFKPDNGNNWSGFTDGGMYSGSGDVIECGNWVGHEQHHGFVMFNISALPTNSQCIAYTGVRMYQNQYLQGSEHKLKFDIGWANTDPRPDARATIMNAISNMERYHRYDVYATPAACSTCKAGSDYVETSNGWKDFDIDYDLARNRVKTQRASKDIMTFGLNMTDFSTTQTNILYWRSHKSAERPQLVVIYNTDNAAPTASVSTTQPSTCDGDGLIEVNPTSTKGSTWFGGYYGNSAVWGNHTIHGNASYNNDGFLKLTDIGGAQQKGTIKLQNPQNFNASSIDFDFDFYAQPQSNSGGDGWSITYAGDIPASPSASQEGLSTTGLVISFREWTGSSAVCKNAISVWYNNQQVGSCALNNSAWIGATWRKVALSINTSNQLTLTIGSSTAFSNLQLPSTYANQNKTGWEVAISAGGGGMKENYSLRNLTLVANNQYEYSIDNGASWQASNQFTKKAGTYAVKMRSKYLSTTCNPEATISNIQLSDPPKPSITTQPVSSTLCEDGNGQLQVATSASNPSYQWQYLDGATWENTDGQNGINGHHTNSLALSNVPLALSNTQFRCVVTENNCVSNSIEAIISVDEAPSAIASLKELYLCAELEASNITAGANISWVKTQGSGSESSNGNILNVSNLAAGANTQYKLQVSKGACQDVEASTVNINVPQVSDAISSIDNDHSVCVFQDGDEYKMYGTNGNLIVELSDVANNNIQLDRTEAKIRLAETVPTITTDLNDLQPYLQRSIAITPNTNSSTLVKLYFTQAEYDALYQAAQGTKYEFSSPQDLLVTKIKGEFPIQNNNLNAEKILIKPIIASVNGGYYAEIIVDDFSTFYIHSSNTEVGDGALPVELVTFTGYHQNTVNVLNWETASELNTEAFEIEHSVNGIDWQNIGLYPAAGNSNISIQYSFVDVKPQLGNNYYRLKIVDFDATFDYSRIINIPVVEESKLNNGITNVYPNPSSGLFYINIQSTKDYKAVLEVYNMQGQRLKSIENSIVKGDNVQELDLESLPQGAYILTVINADGLRSERKIIKR